MEVSRNNTVLNKVSFAHRNAFVIVFCFATVSSFDSTVKDVKFLAAVAGSDFHQVLHPLVFVEVIRFAKVSKGFMGKRPAISGSSITVYSPALITGAYKSSLARCCLTHLVLFVQCNIKIIVRSKEYAVLGS